MTLSSGEINICNQALDRIGAAQIDSTHVTTNEYLVCDRNYVQVRDSLLRSYEWPFARTRALLSSVHTIEFDTAPGPSSFAVGDVITGVTSGATATVLEVISAVKYKIVYLNRHFEDSETVTNAIIYDVTWQGIPVKYSDSHVVWYTGGSQVVCTTGYPNLEEVRPIFGYAHQFLLPPDFDRLVNNDWYHYCHHHTIEGNCLLTDGGFRNHHHEHQNYGDNQNEHEHHHHHGHGEHILYIRKETDTTLFDSLFTDVLILKLGLRFINPLASTGATAPKEELGKEMRVLEAKARTVCACEENNTGRSDWNSARYSSGKMMCRR
jgi:hypothetical protein